MRIFIPSSGVRNSFLTFYYYIKNVAQYLKEEYGRDPSERYGNIYTATAALTARIRPRKNDDLGTTRRYLKAAMANLICLHREADDKEFFEAKNAWTPAQGWYAVHDLMCSLAPYISPGVTVNHDRSCKNARQLICDRALLPYPWAAYVEGGFENGRRVDAPMNFRRDPTPVSNLSAPTVEGFEDSYAIFLSTTLEKRAQRHVTRLRAKPVKGRTRRNISATRMDEVFRGAGPVTLFDALYRLRIRANYGDVDTFVEGCVGVSEAQGFAQALHVVSDASVAALENVLAAYAGEELVIAVLEELARRSADEQTVAARLAFHLGSR